MWQFGQRARHQLLLDQEMSGCPDRNNLLLATLGPGLSACLLDLFMMSAGPNLRGKVAHGEMDMSGVFPPFQCSSDPGTWCSDSTRRSSRGGEFGSKTRSAPDADIVKLTAGVFLVLCWRYDLGRGVTIDAHSGGIEPNNAGVDEPVGGGIGIENTMSPPPRLSNGFVQALSAADFCCSGWVPRFHPHELLEVDLRAARDEFDHLALALERRVISVELLPAGELACMSVAVMGDTVQAMAAAGREGYKAGDQPNTPEFEKREEGGQQQEDGKGVKAARNDAQSSEETINQGNHGGNRGHTYTSLEEASASFENTARNLVLRVTDTASRLMPPPSLAPKPAGGGSNHAPPATSGVHETPTKKNNQDSAGHGVFPGLLRVDEALREHTTSLTTRFERTTTHHQHPCHRLHVGDGGGGGGGSTERYQACSARTAAWEPLAPSPISAFAVYFYQHSKLCSDAEAPSPCCPDGHGLQGCSVFSEDDAANDGARATNAGASHEKGSSGRGPSACSGDKHRWSRVPNSGGSPRISPPTNVIKVVPLPQIACMSGLCRLCAEVARGLRERIVELEVLLAAGSARSGQRRTYATTLRVAPTLLRFLASAVAAVELFVIEWDQHTASSARTVVAETAEETVAATTAVPPHATAGLRFLRRLAAVTGALGLCVTSGAEPSSGSSTSGSKRATCKEKERAGGSGKKGFVQALAELASFLETKTARQGFAGCS